MAAWTRGKSVAMNIKQRVACPNAYSVNPKRYRRMWPSRRIILTQQARPIEPPGANQCIDQRGHGGVSNVMGSQQ